MSDDRDIGWAAFGFGFGIWSFFLGFTRLRRKRLIENIPTSTVRGMAMGLVELIGQARRVKTLRGPLSGFDCVAYRYLVERYERRGKSGSWVTIAQGDSFYCPFWIDDGTGKVLVSPPAAELILAVSYEFRTGLGKNIPDNLMEFLNTHNIRYKTGLLVTSLRFQEWDIFPEQTVYVLGSARKKETDWIEHNDKLHQRIAELKSNQEKMKAIDDNKDGAVDGQEWSQAVAKLEQELLEEEVKSASQEEHADVIIGQGSETNTFIISDHSQKELIQRLNWEVIGGIFGGVVLTLVSMAYLLTRLGLVG
ncbi:MAG: GIDE domain-containing protein [Candidatus Omnitrophota bacterium]|nr:GIDE domain-containing protein [Candidatus Omnitrophota bacterium]